MEKKKNNNKIKIKGGWKKEQQVEAAQELYNKNFKECDGFNEHGEDCQKDIARSMTPSFIDASQLKFPFSKSINFPHTNDSRLLLFYCILPFFNEEEFISNWLKHFNFETLEMHMPLNGRYKLPISDKRHVKSCFRFQLKIIQAFGTPAYTETMM